MSIININASVFALAKKPQTRQIGEYTVRVSLERRKAENGVERCIIVRNAGTDDQSLFVTNEAGLDSITDKDAAVFKLTFSKEHKARIGNVLDKFVAQRREDGSIVLSRTLQAVVGVRQGKFYVHGLLTVSWKEGKPSLTRVSSAELTRMGLQVGQLASAIARPTAGNVPPTTEPPVMREQALAGTTPAKRTRKPRNAS